jgi:hypothetical protein
LLREASTTLKVVMRPDALCRAEPDIAALMEAEGIAMRPGPRPVIAAGVLPALRRAILGMQLVVVRYAGPTRRSRRRASFALRDSVRRTRVAGCTCGRTAGDAVVAAGPDRLH